MNMITVIGAARTEVSMLLGMNDPNSKEELAKQKKIKTFFCGSGINIARHLADDGHEVSLITVVGNDPMGMAAVEDLKQRGVDTSRIEQLEGTSPIQVRTYNVLGDVEQEQKNDQLLEQLDISVIKKHRDYLQNSEAIVLDGSVPGETIKYLSENYGERLFFDPETMEGADKARECAGNFYAVMPGRMEAEIITGKRILSPDELMEAGKIFADKGVTRIVITMKGGGLYYTEGINEGILTPERVLSFANTRGAGDIVSAAVVSASVKGLGIEETGVYAMNKAAEYLADIEDEKLI